MFKNVDKKLKILAVIVTIGMLVLGIVVGAGIGYLDGIGSMILMAILFGFLYGLIGYIIGLFLYLYAEALGYLKRNASATERIADSLERMVVTAELPVGEPEQAAIAPEAE